MNMGSLLSAKVAVITGSSRGLGLSMAQRFAREGAAVVISSRRQQASQQAAENLSRQGYSAAAWLQAMDINSASLRPSSLRCCPGLGSSLKTRSKPPSTKRLCIRSTQGRLTFSAAMICASVIPIGFEQDHRTLELARFCTPLAG